MNLAITNPELLGRIEASNFTIEDLENVYVDKKGGFEDWEEVDEAEFVEFCEETISASILQYDLYSYFLSNTKSFNIDNEVERAFLSKEGNFTIEEIEKIIETNEDEDKMFVVCECGTFEEVNLEDYNNTRRAIWHRKTRADIVNDKFGFDTANDTQAVCESAKSDKIVEFMRLDKFNDKFLELKNNGEIWGVFYDKKGSLVAQEIGGGIVKDIIYED